jgi:hypothetical protein
VDIGGFFFPFSVPFSDYGFFDHLTSIVR